VADRSDAAQQHNPLNPNEFHVLMALAEGPSYGYALMKAVSDHSGGAVTPEIGSLYRVLARLMDLGWVEEAETPADVPAAHRGRTRRYYAITPAGRLAVRREADRLAGVVALARERDLLSPRRVR